MSFYATVSNGTSNAIIPSVQVRFEEYFAPFQTWNPVAGGGAVSFNQLAANSNGTYASTISIFDQPFTVARVRAVISLRYKLVSGGAWINLGNPVKVEFTH